MASTPVPPKPAAGSVPQHIALYESLPSLIAQVRAGKIALGTTLQLRLIIGKHRKQATAHLLSKGLPDPFVNLPAGLNPDIKLPPELEALQLEVSKNTRPAAGSANPTGGTPNDQPRPAMANPQARPPQAGQAGQTAARNSTPGMVRPPAASGVRPPAAGTPMQQAPSRPPVQQAQTPQPAANRPQPKPKPKVAPQQVRPPAAPPSTNTASPAPAPAQPSAKTSAVSTPVQSRPSSEAPSQPGQAGTRPPVMAPGGKYSWAQVFQLSEAERQAWFDEVPEAKPAWTRIWNHAAQKKPNPTGGNGSAPGSASGSASPAPLPPAGPSVSASQNPNTAAADILAKNPPPLPNLNLPPVRAAPAPVEKAKPQPKQQPPKQGAPTSAPIPAGALGQNPNQQARPAPSAAAPVARPPSNPRPAGQTQTNPNQPANQNSNPNSSANTGPNSNANNPYAWLQNIRPMPPHLDPSKLDKSMVDFYMGLNEDQARTISQERRDIRKWVRQHVLTRKAEEDQRRQKQQAQYDQQQQSQQQQQKTGQGQQQGAGFKQPAPPGPNQQPTQTARVTLESLPRELQKYKEANNGKNPSMDAVKDLCRRTNTPWTIELERGVEKWCYVAPPKSSKQILSEQVKELAIDVTGGSMDDSMEKLFAGLAEDFYGDNLRGACSASRARSKDEVALAPKDMSFHLRHKQDLVTAGYGQEVVMAGIKRKGLLGYRTDAIKRIKATYAAKARNT